MFVNEGQPTMFAWHVHANLIGTTERLDRLERASIVHPSCIAEMTCQPVWCV